MTDSFKSMLESVNNLIPFFDGYLLDVSDNGVQVSDIDAIAEEAGIRPKLVYTYGKDSVSAVVRVGGIKFFEYFCKEDIEYAKKKYGEPRVLAVLDALKAAKK